MDVVYKIEAEGRQNGTPKSKVVIADSGELPQWFALLTWQMQLFKFPFYLSVALLNLMYHELLI